ncbi:MAG: hypothetical protein ABEK59_00850 [Halobacteria archaeon]
MDRRNFVRNAGVLASGLLLSGCLDDSGGTNQTGSNGSTGGNGTEPGNGTMNGTRGNRTGGNQTQEIDQVSAKVGGTKTVGGLKTKVVEFKTIPPDVIENVETDTGGQFLAVRLQIENEDSSKQRLPNFGPLEKGDLQLMYDGKRMTKEITGSLELKGGDSHEVYENVGGHHVGPGEMVDKWAVFEVPEEFEPSKAVVAITLDTEDGKSETVKWRLSSGLMS